MVETVSAPIQHHPGSFLFGAGVPGGKPVENPIVVAAGENLPRLAGPKFIEAFQQAGNPIPTRAASENHALPPFPDLNQEAELDRVMGDSVFAGKDESLQNPRGIQQRDRGGGRHATHPADSWIFLFDSSAHEAAHHMVGARPGNLDPVEFLGAHAQLAPHHAESILVFLVPMQPGAAVGIRKLGAGDATQSGFGEGRKPGILGIELETSHRPHEGEGQATVHQRISGLGGTEPAFREQDG